MSLKVKLLSPKRVRTFFVCDVYNRVVPKKETHSWQQLLKYSILNGYISRLTFDLMNLINANIYTFEIISQCHNAILWQTYLLCLLYYMEQFETIFIQIGAKWKCDPLYKCASFTCHN